MTLVCFYGDGIAKPPDGKQDKKVANSIVFNGGYTSQKQKWQGPYHNKQLFSWFIPTTTASSEMEYRKLLRTQRENGVEFIGYYYSSCTANPLKPSGHYAGFPERTLPLTSIKYSSWILKDTNDNFVTWPGDKNRYYLDLGIKEVREAILTRAIGNAMEFGANVLFLDNWNYKYWAPAGQTKERWAEKTLIFLKRARELTSGHNLKLVVNTTSSPHYWPEFAPYLDGISYEMAAHPYRLQNKNSYEQELDTYEKMMQMGKTVFLYTDTLTHKGERWDEDGRKVAATAMLVMPKDNPHWGGIYVSPPRYEVWPVGGWPMWPEQLGKPIGPRKWEANKVSRQFERGTITVTIGENPTFEIIFKY